jgi:hypothetical protein
MPDESCANRVADCPPTVTEVPDGNPALPAEMPTITVGFAVEPILNDADTVLPEETEAEVVPANVYDGEPPPPELVVVAAPLPVTIARSVAVNAVMVGAGTSASITPTATATLLAHEKVAPLCAAVTDSLDVSP